MMMLGEEFSRMTMLRARACRHATAASAVAGHDDHDDYDEAHRHFSCHLHRTWQPHAACTMSATIL